MKLPIGILVARKDLIAKLIDKSFAAKTSLKFKVITREMSKYIDIYEEERIALVKKYGTEIDGNITVEQTGDNWQKFMNELTDIANEQVEVTFPTLTEEEIVADPEIKLSARDLLDLEIFYEPTPEPETEEIPEVIVK